MTFNKLKKLVRIEKLYKGIYHFKFPTQKEVAQTMIRFQEHYESPKFKGKIFSLKEFKDWYSKWDKKPSKKKGFTYYSDWSGFNFPSWVLKPFKDKKFKNLTEREKLVLHYASFMNEVGYYIIGTSDDNNNESLDHEMAHGLFYVDVDYHNSVLLLLFEKTKELQPVFDYLRSIGYDDDVLLDEAHAWICHDFKHMEKDGIDVSKLRGLKADLFQIYSKTISDSISF